MLREKWVSWANETAEILSLQTAEMCDSDSLSVICSFLISTRDTEITMHVSHVPLKIHLYWLLWRGGPSEEVICHIINDTVQHIPSEMSQVVFIEGWSLYAYKQEIKVKQKGPLKRWSFLQVCLHCKNHFSYLATIEEIVVKNFEWKWFNPP